MMMKGSAVRHRFPLWRQRNQQCRSCVSDSYGKVPSERFRLLSSLNSVDQIGNGSGFLGYSTVRGSCMSNVFSMGTRNSSWCVGNQKRWLSGYWPTADGANNMHGTTILSVRKGNKVVIIGDGQITQGNTTVKGTAVKVRRLGVSESKEKGDGLDDENSDNTVLAGFAGATADALTLLDRLERKLEQYPGQLTRSCVELAKLWRTDKYLRRLEALMVVADKEVSLTLTGNGDVILSEDGVVGAGSGGTFALSAARALMDLVETKKVDLDAEEIARRSMKVASDLCVYTNSNYTIEVIEVNEEKAEDANKAKTP